MAMKTRLSLFLLVFSLIFVPAQAQEVYYDIPEPVTGLTVPEVIPPMPRHFRGLSLGMSLGDLQEELVRDTLFRFRGERDVSFLPLRQEALVETGGNAFVSRAHFQLWEGEVFIMSFTLNTQLIDHHTMFTTFVSRFGEPVVLNPNEAIWEDDYTVVSIERPLTVKYIDRIVFDRIREEARTEQHWLTITREQFLDEF